MTSMNKSIFLTSLLLPAFCVANNIETWNTIQLSTKATESISVGVSEGSRIGVNQANNPKTMDEFHTTVFADWRVL